MDNGYGQRQPARRPVNDIDFNWARCVTSFFLLFFVLFFFLIVRICVCVCAFCCEYGQRAKQLTKQSSLIIKLPVTTTHVRLYDAKLKTNTIIRQKRMATSFDIDSGRQITSHDDFNEWYDRCRCFFSFFLSFIRMLVIERITFIEEDTDREERKKTTRKKTWELLLSFCGRTKHRRMRCDVPFHLQFQCFFMKNNSGFVVFSVHFRINSNEKSI